MSNPMLPVCSICIANYNGETMLVDCLESISNQGGDVPIEVIVHDDASTDNSLAVLKRYAKVVVIQSEDNVGFCIANNRMVARARGEYILLLNNDAALYPDALATLIDLARRQTPQGILTLPQYDWQTGQLVDRGCLLDPFCNPVPNLDPARRDVAMVIGACLFMTRARWNELGGFPEWFESIGEDLYLCCLARLRGAPVWASPVSGYRHRQGASFGGSRVTSAGQLQTTFRRRRLSERNKTAVLFITTPSPLMWVLLAVHLMALCFEGLILSVLKADFKIWIKIYWPALTFPIRNFKTIARLRKQQQSIRNVGLRSFLKPVRWTSRKLSLLFTHGSPKISE